MICFYYTPEQPIITNTHKNPINIHSQHILALSSFSLVVVVCFYTIPYNNPYQHTLNTSFFSLPSLLFTGSGVFLYDTIPSDRSICGMVIAMLGVIAYTEENRRQQSHNAGIITTTSSPEIKSNGSSTTAHDNNTKSNGSHDHKSNGSTTHHPFSQSHDKTTSSSSSSTSSAAGGGEPFVDVEKTPLMVSDKDKGSDKDKSSDKKKWSMKERDAEMGSNIDDAP